MKLKCTRRNFFIAAILLLAVGGGILQIGLVILYDDLQKGTGRELEQEIKEFELGKLMSYNIEPLSVENAPFKKIKINFDSDTIFVGDKIWVRANADVTDPNLLSIFLIPTESDVDLSSKSAAEIESLIKKSAEYGKIIEVTRLTEPQFERSIEMPFDNIGDIIFQVILLNSDGRITHTERTGTAVTVHPRTEQINVKTNQAIMQQIIQDNITAEVQNRKTDIIIGISWIAVAFVPFVIAGDILIRLFLDSSDNTQTKSTLTEKPDTKHERKNKHKSNLSNKS